VVGAKSDDGTLAADSAITRWDEYILEAADKAGSPLRCEFYKQGLVDAGFVDVVEVHSMWPTNTWPKDKKWKTVGK